MSKMGLRITTWNVNGIRNPFGYQPWSQKRTFESMFDILGADIVVMQETKIQRKDLRDDMVLVPGWDVHFSLPKHKKGYSGVAIYTRNSKCCPIRAEEGITGVLCPPNSTTPFRDLPADQQIGGYPTASQLDSDLDEATLDSEGRCVILEFPAFVLIGVYSPATRDDTRTEFRMGFHAAMDVRIRNLVAMGKQVILTGDLNIIRDELDSAKLREGLRKENMSFEEFMAMPSRRFFNQLLFGGRVFGGPRDEGREDAVMWDICREFHPAREGMFTCWETKKNARPGNFGSRIDYVCCSNGIMEWFVGSNIQEGLHGSDHCPVYSTIGDTVKLGDQELHIEDIMNPPGMFKGGKRLREWTVKDLLPLSAKLIPEFNRRQSIKDMFFKKTAPAAPAVKASDPAPKDAKELPSIPPPPLIANSSTKPSPQKRPAEPMSSNRKKPKPTLAKESSDKSAPGFAQSSLKGFFKRKPAPNSDGSGQRAEPRKEQDGETQGESKVDGPATKADDTTRADGATEAHSTEAVGPAPEEKTVFDPVENKESWSKLLSKRVVPKCEHDEPCISLVTKKPGVNCGRSFYICPRPLGPSGEKEKGTQWRCGTFIWSSDWSKS